MHHQNPKGESLHHSRYPSCDLAPSQSVFLSLGVCKCQALNHVRIAKMRRTKCGQIEGQTSRTRPIFQPPLGFICQLQTTGYVEIVKICKASYRWMYRDWMERKGLMAFSYY